MELYIFNKNFEMQGIIDTFTSLIWRRDFFKTGTFELHLNLPEDDKKAAETINLLQKGNILTKDDSLEEAVYIEDINLDEQEQEQIVVSGYFIDNFIAKRIIWGLQSKSGTVEEVMKHYVDKNSITPLDTNRVIPNLVLSQNTGISKQANEVSSYENLAEKIEELALKYDVGWRVLFNLANQQYAFDVYQGCDRSINQTINPIALFALEYENVLQQSFTDSDQNYKNMALIGGQGDGINRKLATINNNLQGFERRELFVDARDLSNVTEDEVTLTDPQYEALLIERGNSKLAEMTTIQTFQSGISVTSNLVYKQDFDLGDIVTIKNDRWGVLLNTRITTVEEVYENETKDIRVNFGSNIPTLIDKIKQRMR
jgi:hypothetical protein